MCSWRGGGGGGGGGFSSRACACECVCMWGEGIRARCMRAGTCVCMPCLKDYISKCACEYVCVRA